MEKDNYVYLVIESFATNFENGRTINCFSSYEKAKKYFQDTINEYKKDDMLYDTTEEQEDYFSTYEDGYYSENHNNLEILKLEIK